MDQWGAGELVRLVLYSKNEKMENPGTQEKTPKLEANAPVWDLGAEMMETMTGTQAVEGLPPYY